MSDDARSSSECEICAHGLVAEDENKLLKSYCQIRDKYYIFGQYIQCDEFKKDSDKVLEVEEAKAKRRKLKEKEKKKNDRKSKSDN